MIIRQRTTLLDSVLLKVVFPYLEQGGHRSLLRLASLWRGEVTNDPRQERQRARHSKPLGDLILPWRNALRAITRVAQPQHALATVPIPPRRGRVRTRAFDKNAYSGLPGASPRD